MKKRLFGSLIFLIIILAALLLRTFSLYVFDPIILLAMILSAVEMNRAVRVKYPVPYLGVLMLSVPLMYAVFITGNIFLAGSGLTMAFALVFIILLVIMLVNAFKRASNDRIFTTTLILVYPLSLFMFMFALNHSMFGWLPLVLVLAVSCLSDVLALFVGTALKGPKLAPTISPKKTVSGAIGGLVGGLIGSYFVFILAYYRLFPELYLFTDNLTANIVHFAAFGLAGSFFTQGGDLIASFFKRRLDIKDYGHLIPGHGGIMDRFDGIIFNALFLYCYLAVVAVFL